MTYAITDREQFEQLFKNPDLTVAQIAEYFNVSSYTVTDTARRFGFPHRKKLLASKPTITPKKCNTCLSLHWCKTHPYAEQLPCETELTPRVSRPVTFYLSTFMAIGVIREE